MTTSLTHDRPENASTEESHSGQWSVGWVLTAITCAILVVGVAIIRQLSASPEPLLSESEAVEKLSATPTPEQELPPRLVLRPEETDSVPIPHFQQRPQFQQGMPASWEEDEKSEGSFILPAYH